MSQWYNLTSTSRPCWPTTRHKVPIQCALNCERLDGWPCDVTNITVSTFIRHTCIYLMGAVHWDNSGAIRIRHRTHHLWLNEVVVIVVVYLSTDISRYVRDTMYWTKIHYSYCTTIIGLLTLTRWYRCPSWFCSPERQFANRLWRHSG